MGQNIPSGQRVHAVAPIEGIKEPAAQAAHENASVAPVTFDDVPAGQSVGAVEADPHHDPGGHWRHVLDVTAPFEFEYEPALQGVGAVLAGQKYPAAHGSTLVTAPGGQLMPASHGRHVPSEIAPKAVEYVPPGHDVHAVIPGFDAKVPCGQVRHVTRP